MLRYLHPNCIPRKSEVDDHVHSLDVDTTGRKIGTCKVAAITVPVLSRGLMWLSARSAFLVLSSISPTPT